MPPSLSSKERGDRGVSPPTRRREACDRGVVAALVSKNKLYIDGFHMRPAQPDLTDKVFNSIYEQGLTN